MTDTRSLTSLFEAIAHQDWDGSRATALEIAAKEESKGNRRVAGTLRGGSQRDGKQRFPYDYDFSCHDQNQTEFQLSRALVRCPDGPPVTEIALRPAMRKALEEILNFCGKCFDLLLKLSACSFSMRSMFWHAPPSPI